MITKRPPFKSNSMKELYKKVITAKYPPLKPRVDLSVEMCNLVKMILQPNPRLRPSCYTLLNQTIIQLYIHQEGLITESNDFEDQLNYLVSNPANLS